MLPDAKSDWRKNMRRSSSKSKVVPIVGGSRKKDMTGQDLLISTLGNAFISEAGIHEEFPELVYPKDRYSQITVADIIGALKNDRLVVSEPPHGKMRLPHLFEMAGQKLNFPNQREEDLLRSRSIILDYRNIEETLGLSLEEQVTATPGALLSAPELYYALLVHKKITGNQLWKGNLFSRTTSTDIKGRIAVGYSHNGDIITRHFALDEEGDPVLGAVSNMKRQAV